MRSALRQVLLTDDYRPTAFSAVRRKIVDGASDVSILVIGDSTGDSTSEWVYLFATWLGEQHPSHTIRYRLWDNVTPAYGSSSDITTGTGSRIIDFYNFSVSGSRSTLIQGDRFAAGVTATGADLVIWNHGHNHVSGATAPLVQGEILGSVDQVRLALPNANHAAFIQNPWRDDTTMNLADQVWRSIALSWPEMTLIDVHTKFVGANKPSAWYSDNVHPNSTGQAVVLAQIKDVWGASSVGANEPGDAWFSSEVTNYLANGDLTSTGTSAPASWTTQGTLAFSREGTIVYPGYSSSLKLEGSGAAQALIRQSLSGGSLTPLLGQSVFVTALVYVPTGADNTVGRIAINTNGTGGTTHAYRGSNSARDGWMLVGVGPVTVPSDATSLTVYLYHDTDSTPDTDPAYFQRVCLSLGSVPRDFA